MPEDRCEATCPARALESWMHPATLDVIRLCRHHSRTHQMALHYGGYALVEAEAPELHPSLGPVTADPATH